MAFDKDKPASSTSLRNSNPEILANQSALEDAIDREHEFSTGGTVADQGHHVRGSARAYFQDAEPATRVNGEAFNSEDLGSLWFDSNASPDNEFFVLTATTPTWTPVSTEIIETLLAANRVFAGTLGVTGDFAVNTDKVTVDGTTGNTVVAGTLDVTGVLTTTAASVLGDGSTLAAATESGDGDRTISDKAYVDDEITGIFSPTTESDASDTTGTTTFSNGFVIRRGQQTISLNAEETVDVSATMNAVYSVSLTWFENDNTDRSAPKLSAIANTSFNVRNTNATNLVVKYIAIGR